MRHFCSTADIFVQLNVTIKNLWGNFFVQNWNELCNFRDFSWERVLQIISANSNELNERYFTNCDCLKVQS